MSWLERVGTKVKLRMTAWLSTLFIIGSFISLYMHQFGYKLDATILGMLIGGLVAIMTSLFNVTKKEELTETNKNIIPIANDLTCHNCGTPLNK